jgi:NADP-dependent alcohol dehydrogenase
MQNFTYHNPTKIVFGKGTIAQLPELLPDSARVLMTYGGGSIKRNGVYDQVMEALKGRDFLEFGGIEPNPRYETLMKAVELGKTEGVDFLLPVGGGSTVDGTKFVAAAMRFEDGDPWAICRNNAPVTDAVPLGCVLTLPATGSESNGAAVITRDETHEKLAFISDLVKPVFAILDPSTTYTLPLSQTRNGVADAFVHVLEQYMTYPVNAPLQDRQAEAIMKTLIEEGPKVLARPGDYETRANIMWSATQALNGLIACGVPQDWSTHMIGHELTALYGLDHAHTLTIVYPAMMRFKKQSKRDKLLQYAERVWSIEEGDPDQKIEEAIVKTEAFFRELGFQTRLAEADVTEGIERVGQRIEDRGGFPLGEHGDIGRVEVDAILTLAAS